MRTVNKKILWYHWPGYHAFSEIKCEFKFCIWIISSISICIKLNSKWLLASPDVWSDPYQYQMTLLLIILSTFNISKCTISAFESNWTFIHYIRVWTSKEAKWIEWKKTPFTIYFWNNLFYLYIIIVKCNSISKLPSIQLVGPSPKNFLLCHQTIFTSMHHL